MAAPAENQPEVPRADDALSIELDARQFSREAVQRAAYWFSKDWEIEFVPSAVEWRIDLVFRPKVGRAGADRSSVRSRFTAAVLDAELRLQIGRETAGVRELILAKAFSEAGVLEPDEE